MPIISSLRTNNIPPFPQYLLRLSPRLVLTYLPFSVAQRNLPSPPLSIYHLFVFHHPTPLPNDFSPDDILGPPCAYYDCCPPFFFSLGRDEQPPSPLVMFPVNPLSDCKFRHFFSFCVLFWCKHLEGILGQTRILSYPCFLFPFFVQSLLLLGLNCVVSLALFLWWVPFYTKMLCILFGWE